DVCGESSEPVDAGAGLAGLPLDRAVIEDDVEVAGPRVVALDEQQLEAVELVVALVVVADVHPVDAERRVALVERVAEAIADELAAAARVDVREEGSDDR